MINKRVMRYSIIAIVSVALVALGYFVVSQKDKAEKAVVGSYLFNAYNEYENFRCAMGHAPRDAKELVDWISASTRYPPDQSTVKEDLLSGRIVVVWGAEGKYQSPEAAGKVFMYVRDARIRGKIPVIMLDGEVQYLTEVEFQRAPRAQPVPVEGKQP